MKRIVTAALAAVALGLAVEELLEGTWPTLPDMADPYTGRRVRQAELFE